MFTRSKVKQILLDKNTSEMESNSISVSNDSEEVGVNNQLGKDGIFHEVTVANVVIRVRGQEIVPNTGSQSIDPQLIMQMLCQTTEQLTQIKEQMGQQTKQIEENTRKGEENTQHLTQMIQEL